MDRNEKIYLDGKHLGSDLLVKQIMRMAGRIDLLRSRVNNQRIAIIAKNQHINNLNKVIEVKEQRIINLIRELIQIKKYYGFDSIIRKIWKKLQGFRENTQGL